MHGGAVLCLTQAQIGQGTQLMQLLQVFRAGSWAGQQERFKAGQGGEGRACVPSAQLFEGQLRIDEVLLDGSQLAAPERRLQVAGTLGGLVGVLTPVRGGVDRAQPLLHGPCRGRGRILRWRGSTQNNGEETHQKRDARPL